MYKKNVMNHPQTALFVALIFFISGLIPAEQDQKKKNSDIRLVQFIPGISQLKNGKTIKGGFLLGAFLTTIGGAIISNNKGNDYYEQYLDSVIIEDIVDLRKMAENHYRLRNYFMAGIFAVWVIHLLDIKFFKKRGGIKGEIKNHGVHFGLYVSF
jgi:hypothetical protein